MATKKKTAGRKTNAVKTRVRRTDDQIINDLKEKLRQVKLRAAARELKSSAAIKTTLTALRAISKALDAAAEEGETHLRHALADARKPLAEFLGKHGVPLPKANLPKGRKPREL